MVLCNMVIGVSALCLQSMETGLLVKKNSLSLSTFAVNQQFLFLVKAEGVYYDGSVLMGINSVCKSSHEAH